MRKIRLAFTLAETLITLGIIGIVAALTMPTLIQNYQEKATVVRLKKVYTTLSQIYERVTQEYGTPDEWDIPTNTTSNIYFEKMENYTNKLKICKGLKCSTKYNRLDGTFDEAANYRIADNPMILADGTHVRIDPNPKNLACSTKRGQTNALGSICSEIFIDINAQKPPNTYGKDVFVFYWTKYGIIPTGLPQEQSHLSFANCSQSANSIYSGYGCAAWVLINENMDYLHCQDLNWFSKKSCKN